jgi:hypothetical protein
MILEGLDAFNPLHVKLYKVALPLFSSIPHHQI